MRQVSVYVCYDAVCAHRRLLSLLMRFGAALPHMTALPATEVPDRDVRFAAEGGAVVVGAALNVVVSVTRASRGSAASIGAERLYTSVVEKLLGAAQPVPP
jgi:hypothetical protein